LAAEFLSSPVVLLALPVLLPALLLSLSFAQFLIGLRDDATFFWFRADCSDAQSAAGLGKTQFGGLGCRDLLHVGRAKYPYGFTG
jgi:hypothetical protein